MDASIFILATIFAGYILASRLAMRGLRGTAREVVMGILNLAGIYYFFLDRKSVV